VSPLFITKLYKPLIAYLQARGHRTIIYIDDMLIFGETKQECEDSVRAVIEQMKRLGVIINQKKSVFSPSQQVEYLGFIIDSVEMTITAPKKKIESIRKDVKKFCKRQASTPRQLASILGKINSLADAMFPVRVCTAAYKH
jgi:hypothetical protein